MDISVMTRQWAEWIAQTSVSTWFQVQSWVVPTSQSVHILGVAVIFTSALMISARLLNIGPRGRSLLQLVDLLVPWMYRALAVLLITGMIQTIAEPVRQFVTPAFWLKMVMIVCVTALTFWFGRTVRRNAAKWNPPETRPPIAKIFALVWLGLWMGIIICGRLIGYTWNFYV